MLRTAAKRNVNNGKSGEQAQSRKQRFPRGTAAAKSPVVPLVVTPETASHSRASTSTLIESSTRQSSTPSTNLSVAFYAELSAGITKNTSSVVKKKAEYIDFRDEAQVKLECTKYIKASELPIDQQSQISFLVRKFNASAITAAFSMLIGKVAGELLLWLFFPLPSKKEDLIQQFLCLIYDTKSMMINTELECYRYVKKYSDYEYFIFCYLPMFDDNLFIL